MNTAIERARHYLAKLELDLIPDDHLFLGVAGDRFLNTAKSRI